MILYSNVFWILYTVYLLFLDFLWVQFSGICSSLLQAHRRPPSPWRLCKTHRPEPESSRSPRRQRGQHQRRGWGSCQKLPGNNSHLYRWRVFILFVDFHPWSLGKKIQIDEHIFSKGLVQPPTKHYCTVFEKGVFFQALKNGSVFCCLTFVDFQEACLPVNSSKGTALYLLFWIGFNDFWILVERYRTFMTCLATVGCWYSTNRLYSTNKNGFLILARTLWMTLWENNARKTASRNNLFQDHCQLNFLFSEIQECWADLGSLFCFIQCGLQPFQHIWPELQKSPLLLIKDT